MYRNFQQLSLPSKILFKEKLSDFIVTFTYFYQIPYPKKCKIWTKLNNFLLNKIFIRILTLFFRITPYVLSTLWCKTNIFVWNSSNSTNPISAKNLNQHFDVCTPLCTLWPSRCFNAAKREKRGDDATFQINLEP